jgi:hypothetical protein
VAIWRDSEKEVCDERDKIIRVGRTPGHYIYSLGPIYEIATGKWRLVLFFLKWNLKIG